MEERIKRILIVDDDRSTGLMLKMFFEFNGYEAIVSENPNETEENIRKHEIDLVILDMLLLGVNGAEVCVRLKKDAFTKDTPVLMMSAFDGAGKTCKAAGADDFISKPFELEELRSKIRRILFYETEKRS